jgi:hypothetical protein
MSSHLLSGFKSKAKKLLKVAAREPGPDSSSPTASSMPTQPALEAATRPSPQATHSPPASTDPETSPLPNLQERIWNQAYDELKANEPKVVGAFEKIVSAELRRNEMSHESTDRTENDMTGSREARSHQLQQLIRDGLDRTKKQASIKQGIDDGLQAVQAVRGIMDRAVHAAPEAAVAWAAVCLGLEVCDSFPDGREKKRRTVLC